MVNFLELLTLTVWFIRHWLISSNVDASPCHSALNYLRPVWSSLSRSCPYLVLSLYVFHFVLLQMSAPCSTHSLQIACFAPIRSYVHCFFSSLSFFAHSSLFVLGLPLRLCLLLRSSHRHLTLLKDPHYLTRCLDHYLLHLTVSSSLTYLSLSCF